MLDAINTNVIAMQTQDNLNNSQMSLSKSIERLSSGLRINSAQDDPAGLAIASRMTSQISGLSQATNNANEGVNMLQTADGGLSSATQLLQSMRGLAVEAANGTNSASDLQSLQTQITQLQNEIQQISTTTQYNGISLINGGLGSVQFQVGANAGQTISFGISSAQTTALGNNNISLSATGSTGLTDVGTSAAAGSEVNNFGTTATTMTIQGNGKSSSIALAASATAAQIAASVNAATGTTGVTATASAQAVLTLAGSGNASFNIVGGSGFNTVSISAAYTAGSGGLNAVVAAINQQSTNTGVTAQLNSGAGGGIILSNTTGNNIDIQNTSPSANALTLYGYNAPGATGSPAGALDAGVAIVQGNGAVVGGNVTFNSANGFAINAGANTGALFSAAGEVGSTLQAVSTIDVTAVSSSGTPTGANSALSIIDAAIANINANRANIGALQNRFTSAASNLQTASLNLSSSLSTVQDTNFAAETTNLSRAQILQQAGTAMLAQANSLPNGVLALLR